jgi:transposase
MEWPAHSASLDLNPIENVWQIIKHCVEKIHPDNITYWKVKIMETWMSLDQNYIYI